MATTQAMTLAGNLQHEAAPKKEGEPQVIIPSPLVLTREQELRMLGDEVWGTGTENHYQQGYVFSRIEDAQAKLNLKADYTVESASADPSKIMVLHRRKAGQDVYYIANQSDKAQDISLSFRVAGKQPELWQAEDGSITDAPVWRTRTRRSPSSTPSRC